MSKSQETFEFEAPQFVDFSTDFDRYQGQDAWFDQQFVVEEEGSQALKETEQNDFEESPSKFPARSPSTTLVEKSPVQVLDFNHEKEIYESEPEEGVDEGQTEEQACAEQFCSTELTVPVSPFLHTKERAKLRNYQEKPKFEEKEQEPFESTNFELTVPASPFLHTKERAKLRHVEEKYEEKQEKIENENFEQTNFELTIPVSPRLHTIERAIQKGIFPKEIIEKETETKKEENFQKTGEPTIPVSPKLMTKERAHLRGFSAEQFDEKENFKNNEKKKEIISQKPFELTVPVTPKLRTKERALQRYLVQDEEKVGSLHHIYQPTFVVQKSTKPLTIPMTPDFEVVKRSRTRDS